MFGVILPATVTRIAKKVSLALLAACLPVVAQSAQNTTHYRWSADNWLTEVQSGNTRVSYGYDALGRRISRTWQQGNHTRETQWVLDTARPYSEIVLERTRSNGGAWKERAYVHTPDGVGLQISESEEGQTRHIYTDAQGSTRLITDEAGNVLQTLDYDAFGNEQTSGPTRHRYTGESFDSATGLYHLRARDYDPSTGRFISMDEHPGSRTIPLTLNKYLYGNADPVNHIDPSGNFVGGGLGSVGIGLNVQTSLRVQAINASAGLTTTVKTRVILAMAVSYAGANSVGLPFAVDAAVKENIKRCIRDSNEKGRSDCDPVLPMLVVGDNNNEVQDHIAYAQGELLKPRAVTRRFESHKRYWLERHKGPGKMCTGAPGTDCDEYPMATHVEGGELNSPSLRSVNFSQNRSVGSFARHLHEKCRVAVGEKYMVVPMKGIPISGYICKK